MGHKRIRATNSNKLRTKLKIFSILLSHDKQHEQIPKINQRPSFWKTKSYKREPEKEHSDVTLRFILILFNLWSQVEPDVTHFSNLVFNHNREL